MATCLLCSMFDFFFSVLLSDAEDMGNLEILAMPPVNVPMGYLAILECTSATTPLVEKMNHVWLGTSVEMVLSARQAAKCE